jgi:hypothetical protein
MNWSNRIRIRIAANWFVSFSRFGNWHIKYELLKLGNVILFVCRYIHFQILVLFKIQYHIWIFSTKWIRIFTIFIFTNIRIRILRLLFSVSWILISDNIDYPLPISIPSGVKHLTILHCCPSQQTRENRYFTYLLQIIVGGTTTTRAELPCRAVHACLLPPQIVFQHIFLTHPSNYWDLFYRLMHVYMHACITCGITVFCRVKFSAKTSQKS